MHRREKSLWKHRLLKRCVNSTSGNVANETKEGFVRYGRILAEVNVYSFDISIRVNHKGRRRIIYKLGSKVVRVG